jgi:hypothetical protein
MRGGALPAAMVIAALALMLGFVSRKTAALALAAAAIVAATVSWLPVPDDLIEAAFLACWGSVVVIALFVYWPRRFHTAIAVALGVVAGLAAGLVIAAEGTPVDLLRSLPAALLVIPASIAVSRGYAVAPKVVASWLVAVALLAAIIPHVVVHPGYVPDHMG